VARPEETEDRTLADGKRNMIHGGEMAKLLLVSFL
jgi:hypothetical protein